MIKTIIKQFLPPSIYQPVRDHLRKPRMPILFGSLRRLEPVSRLFGFDRGKPIDRFYIESFLDQYRDDIRGDTLEIGDPSYTKQFGDNRVTHSHVLHAAHNNKYSTIVGDLATGEGIPCDAFDCMILTQTFQMIYEVKAAIANCYKALKPGGTLLATFPGISQISRFDMDRWGDYWRFTDRSAAMLFAEAFGDANVAVETYGNVLAATALLQGLSTEELTKKELDHHDLDYQVIITVRATKLLEK